MAALRTSAASGEPLSVPEQTNPPGSASTSTRNAPDSRSSSGSSLGVTGRSLTIESPPLPWIRLARATTPCASRSSSGVSKKKTWRICASSGSSSSAATVERWCGSGTVSFSSTLSAPLSRSSSSTSSSFEKAGRRSRGRRHLFLLFDPAASRRDGGRSSSQEGETARGGGCAPRAASHAQPGRTPGEVPTFSATCPKEETSGYRHP